MDDHRRIDVVGVVEEWSTLGIDGGQAGDEGPVLRAGPRAERHVVEIGPAGGAHDLGGDLAGMRFTQLHARSVVRVAVVLGEPYPVQVAEVGEVGVVGRDGLAGVQQLPKAVVDAAKEAVHVQVDGGVDDALEVLPSGQPQLGRRWRKVLVVAALSALQAARRSSSVTVTSSRPHSHWARIWTFDSPGNDGCPVVLWGRRQESIVFSGMS